LYPFDRVNWAKKQKMHNQKKERFIDDKFKTNKQIVKKKNQNKQKTTN
jgi:hypothetical protein